MQIADATERRFSAENTPGCLVTEMPAAQSKVAKKEPKRSGGRPSAAASATIRKIVTAAYDNLMEREEIKRQFRGALRKVTAISILRELKTHHDLGRQNRYHFRRDFALPSLTTIIRVLDKQELPRFRPHNHKYVCLHNSDDGKGPSRFSQ